MITIRELLDDKQYREFFLKKPEIPNIKRTAPPWRIYVQSDIDGAWARAETDTYIQAFKFLKKKLLEGIHDGAIQSKGVAFKPPERWVRVTRGGKPVWMLNSAGLRVQKTKLVVWKPKLPEGEPHHSWCMYCRRPTIFRYFGRHHAFRKTEWADLSRDRRCTICGSTYNLAGVN